MKKNLKFGKCCWIMMNKMLNSENPKAQFTCTCKKKYKIVTINEENIIFSHDYHLFKMNLKTKKIDHYKDMVYDFLKGKKEDNYVKIKK